MKIDLARITTLIAREVSPKLVIGNFPRESSFHLIPKNQSNLSSGPKPLLQRLKNHKRDRENRSGSALIPDIPHNQFQKFDESPGFERLSNVIYLPQYRCLFSRNGDRIDNSFSFSRRDEIPASVSLPKTIVELKKELLFIGDFEHFHYGHFLVEGISFLWGLAYFKELPMLYSGCIWGPRTIWKRLHLSFIDEFMELIGLNRENLHSFDRPVRIRSVILPRPSLIFGTRVHQIHKLLPEFAAAVHFKSNANWKVSSQPVYLSRRKLITGSRQIFNEDKLETILESRGVRILRPETLSLRQQIECFNKHKYFIGCQGSALHNLLFGLNDDLKMFCLTADDTWLDTFKMIDFVKSVDSQYIYSLKQMETSSKNEWEVNKEINVDMTISHLEGYGLI